MRAPISTLTALFFTLFVAALAMRQNVADAAPYNSTTLNDQFTASSKANGHFAEGDRRLSFADIQAAFESSTLPSKDSSNSALGNALANLVRQQQQEPVGSPGAKPSSEGMATIVDGMVLVEIVGRSAIDGVLAQALAAVNGVNVTGCFHRVCSAFVSLDRLEEVARLNDVKFVRPSMRETNAGSVTSEGDAALGANIARTAFSVNGSGVLIGVISDSYNCLGGAAADIATNDLPQGSDGILLLKDFGPQGCSGSDEGRAMMQLVHDVAPGARIAFRTANLGIADFAAGIIELADAGCNVIVDDVSYLTVPYFQDGAIALAADRAVARGIPYFTSAGNAGRQSWEAPTGFIDSGVNQTDVGLLHRFGISISGGPIISQRITMSNVDTEFSFVFQWDEPSFSVSGAPGSASDLDIYFMANGKVVAEGTDNSFGMDPIEFVSFNPSTLGSVSSTVQVDVSIALFAGPPPKYMKLFSQNRVVFEFATNTPCSYGHKNGARTAGVGAASYLKTPAFGTTPPQIESFSSAGGVPILFAPNGARLGAAEIRKQPRFTGPDGGITTFFGANNRFFGTSAAAPHVAAVAALMLSRNKNLRPEDIYTILANTAIDMDDPFTIGFDAGFDYGTGAGLVNVGSALSVTPADGPVTAPVAAPKAAPVGAPTSAPVAAPVSPPSPSVAPPATAPATAPNSPPVAAPARVAIASPACGLFGGGLFCPFTFCGLFGRLIGFCRV